MLQTRGQDKTSEEELKEMEISSLPDEEFKALVRQMLNECMSG